MNIIVTGAGSGLGRAIASTLRNIHSVIGFVHSQRQAERWGRTMDHCVICDLEDETSIHNAVYSINHSSIDAIINCAGINMLSSFAKMDPAVDLASSMSVNATAIIRLAQALLPDLIKNEGTILNILSDAAWRPMTSSLAYNASKAAAQMITLQMARELNRAHNITVFGIAPAKIAGTPMSKEVDRQVAKVRGWTPEYTEEYHRRNVTMKEDIPVDVLVDFIITGGSMAVSSPMEANGK